MKKAVLRLSLFRKLNVNMCKYLSFIGIFCFTFLSFSQSEKGRVTVEKLCSPEFHGRGYVNGGDSLAANFLANEFKQIGCRFFKNNPFQSFQFNVNTFPNIVSLTIDGRELKPGVDFVVSYDSPAFQGDNMVFLNVSTQDIFDGKILKNKISALAMRGEKKSVGLLFTFPEWKGDTLKAAKELAKSLNTAMPIIEVVNDKFTWSVAQKQVAFPKYTVQQSAFNAHAESWKVSTVVQAKIKSHIARNVIAYAPAKKKSKKYFVFSAHYDHLGRMGQEAFFPGGNDNASGTAMLLEMARYYIQNPADVNVVFIAFAGEEVGLLGSEYYTAHPIFPLNKIQFLFNLDIMGSGEDGATIVNATVFPKEFEFLKSINAANEFLPKINARGKAANSDHYFFTEAGVPAFFIYTMGPNRHYHDTGDTYENLSFAKFDAICKLLIEFQKGLGKVK